MSGVDTLDAKGDDFFFDPHQHAREGLVLAIAVFRCEILESGDAAQLRQQLLNGLLRASNEEIDPLSAQQDGSLQAPAFALGDQPFSQRLEVCEGGKFVGGDVGDDGHERWASPT